MRLPTWAIKQGQAIAFTNAVRLCLMEGGAWGT